MSKKIYTFLLCFLLLCNTAYASPSPEVWFCPNDSGFLTKKDDIDKWADSRKDINVYKFYYQLILNDSTSSLKEKIGFLQANNIKIAIEFPPLVWVEHGEGYKIESFQRKGLIEALMIKLKSIGANLDYIALDEPLYFAHYMKGENSTNYNLDTLASKISESLNLVYSYYPNVRVGEIEPLGAFKKLSLSEKNELLTRWISTFNKANVKPLYFLHDDVSWRDDWQEELILLQELTKKNNLQNGIIFNSAYQWYSPSLWMDSARDNIDKVISFKKVIPNNVIFQSWNKSPVKIAGDYDNLAQSSLIIYFLKKKI